MLSLDVILLQQGQLWAMEGPVWLCTVLSTFGSSPRPPGTMMVINHQGGYSGSLSGGCIEEDFIQRVGRGEFTASSQLVRYGDNGLTPDRALPCGGKVDILVECLPKGQYSADYLRQIEHSVQGKKTVQKRLTFPEPCQFLKPVAWSSSTIVIYDRQQVELILGAAPRLIVAGLSAVAVYCANFAVALGFDTLVCENRPETLKNHASLLIDSINVVERFPANVIEEGACHSHTAVVALTHDARMDDVTLMEAVNTPAFYIGAMGSKRNSMNRLERLQRIAGLDDKQLARIHAPVGMSIGSKTPAEIALAVMADIVRAKNSCRYEQVRTFIDPAATE